MPGKFGTHTSHRTSKDKRSIPPVCIVPISFISGSRLRGLKKLSSGNILQCTKKWLNLGRQYFSIVLSSKEMQLC